MIPAAKTEIAWTSDYSTPEGSRTWTDVTPYVLAVEGINITRGRADELSQVSPSTCSLTLINDDGRFTPERSASPYYPNVKKGKPIRVSVTYDGNTYVRFMGYVDEWPQSWPDGSDLTAAVTISATSRRSRLGLTAPLPSAIRAAYLSTNPKHLWPLDDDTDQHDTSGRQAFRDLQDPFTSDVENVLGAFGATPYKVTVRDGTPGPTDEESLVLVPQYDTTNTYKRYIGAGGAINVTPAGGMTIEILARIDVVDPTSYIYCPLFTLTPRANISQQFTISVGDHPWVEMLYFDDDNNLIEDTTTTSDSVPAVTDGQAHHYLATLSSDGKTARVFFDGIEHGTIAFTSAAAFKKRFGTIILAAATVNCIAHIGWAAIHETVLTDAQILARAQAATTANETVAERVTRLATYLGVPSAELAVEATVAAPLGAQAEKGRSAAEVLDEVAASTGGVLYDDRDGHLVMQARNHRYNSPIAFTLSTTPQEIEPDLTATLDDRYLVNSVDVSKVGDTSGSPTTVTSPSSISAYGVYSKAITTVTTVTNEAEAAARNLLTLYAEPTTRISQVSVDLADLAGNAGATYGSGTYGSGVYPDSTQLSKVLAADIGALFVIANLPAQAPASSMGLFLEGYTETISAVGHTITMNTTPANHVSKWVLGSSTFSVLGSTTIPAY